MGAVSIVLHFARNEAGAGRTLLVAMAAITLVVSWTVLNTQFTLGYAHLYYIEPADGVDPSSPGRLEPATPVSALLATHQIARSAERSHARAER